MRSTQNERYESRMITSSDVSGEFETPSGVLLPRPPIPDRRWRRLTHIRRGEGDGACSAGPKTWVDG